MVVVKAGVTLTAFSARPMHTSIANTHLIHHTSICTRYLIAVLPTLTTAVSSPTVSSSASLVRLATARPPSTLPASSKYEPTPHLHSCRPAGCYRVPADHHPFSMRLMACAERRKESFQERACSRASLTNHPPSRRSAMLRPTQAATYCYKRLKYHVYSLQL
jgi:hypothetical protein